MTISPLTPEQRQDSLHGLSGWTYDVERRALFREIVLADFSAAFALMTRIAMEAEKADHHPEWFNVYNRVSIWLTTHDAGDVSTRDVDLAAIIDRLAPSQSAETRQSD
jgi:4a-hydroxytetrahydrobiopterin dehydratase